jgi:Protein of unknown function (DUF1573)
MRTTLTWAICAVLIGAVAGVALGYWEAHPGKTAPPTPPLQAAKSEAPATAGPKAVVAETTFNFDKMESGATQRREFPITNGGDEPLKIEFVSHTCKCTTVELNGNPVEPGSAVVVPPGEKAVIMLEWAAKVPAGPFRHGATFETNDPAQSRLELHVEGDIVESSTLYPSSLMFGSVRAGDTAQASMLVAASMEDEVQIVSHEVTDAALAERIQVKVEPAAASELPPDVKAAAKITATYTPGGAIGPFFGSLKLKTSLKSAPSFEVPISGNVRGDISLFGPGWTEENGLLRIGQVKSAEGAKRQLHVTLRGEHAKETKLSVGKVEPPELKVTLGEPKSISDKIVQAELTIEIPPGTRPMVRAGEDQGGEGEIVLATTHPVTPQVRLRVTFTVKP